ncbi:MAG: DUF2752 domain-containing protein [Victivallaceae bacterium]|nr:DUF2752 domain-containing protein [Victivallaceae bacterium]
MNRKTTVLMAVTAGWGLYILLLPFISPVMEKLFPALWQCQYKRITGRECPFCGATRDLAAFYSTGKFGSLNGKSALYFIMPAAAVIGAIGLLLQLRTKHKSFFPYSSLLMLLSLKL